MKHILISALFLYSILAMGAPPFGIKGQSQSQAIYPAVQQAPYNQITNLGASNGLVETGSENMLVNPGFEAATTTGWTCTVGTCTVTSTSGEFSSGKRALKVALSAQAMNVSQTVTTPAGIQKQGFVRVVYKVPSTMADFQVCSLVDAVEQNCVPTANLIKDDAFHSIEIPTVFGSTSAGIKFKTTTAYTANVFFDAAIVAQGLGLQNLQGDTAYSAKVSSAGVVSDENKEFITTTTATPASSVYTFTLNAFTSAPNCTVSIVHTSGATSTAIIRSISATQLVVVTADGGAGDRGFDISCQKTGNDYLAASANVYSASNADFGWTSYTPTFTGFGTATNIDFKYKRAGDVLWVVGGFTSGTPTAVGARVSIPTGLSIDTTKVLGTQRTYLGSAVRAISATSTNLPTTGVGPFVVVEDIPTSSTEVLFATSTNTTGNTFPLAIANGFIASGDSLQVVFQVPISGWTQGNTITASFVDVVTTKGASKPVAQHAKVTNTGAVVNLFGGSLFSGPCVVSGTSVFTCPVTANTFTSTPYCQLTVNDSSGLVDYRESSSSSTSVAYRTLDGAEALAARPVFISCFGVAP